MVQRSGEGLLSPNAGIAIGPILFIVAILAILAAAIAAGSGSFTAGTTQEANKTKSSALIQIGDTLATGMARIMMSNVLDPEQIDTNVQNTTGLSALFSPVGGGISAPSVGMANYPLYDTWAFPKGNISGFGTAGNEILAVIPVSRGVCSEINNRVAGIAAVPPAGDYGTFLSTGASQATGDFPASSATWTVGATTTTTTGPTLHAVSTGCLYNTGAALGTGCGAGTCTAGPTTQFFFYQVLAVQ
ncbi:MAG: hypothetical protein PHS57_07455 [Alphaproteobacteria bacterium]|nr:hypothetical protein [Alphaproteobacteria bacterium]